MHQACIDTNLACDLKFHISHAEPASITVRRLEITVSDATTRNNIIHRWSRIDFRDSEQMMRSIED